MSDIQWVAMDPYPRTTEADTRIHPFWTAIGEGRLTTTRCGECGTVAWPPRVVCPACLASELVWTDLPHDGRVAGLTLQEKGLPPGFEGPIVFALVDVGPVRMFTRLIGADPAAIEIGDEVTFEPLTVPPAPGTAEPGERRLPAFRSAQDSEDSAA